MSFPRAGIRPSSAPRLRKKSDTSGSVTTDSRLQLLEQKLTHLLKTEGPTASIEELSSWLYQRAITRYRRRNYLGCSNDCDRVETRCGGCVTGRILFLNAKALRRLRS